MTEFKIVYRDPAELKPYKLNAKKHPSSQVDLLKYSIDTFKPDQPIVIDENDVVIKGHARRLASIELGMKSFPCIVRTDLTDAEKRAARLADNKSNESDWDFDILNIELDELQMDFDIESIGFNLDDELPDTGKNSEPPDDFKEYDEDIDTQYKCPKCSYCWSGKPK